MSKRYEDKEKEIVKSRECVELKCDMCGIPAEYPHIEAWEWGGAGHASGKIEYFYFIDGDMDQEEYDLCYDCAELLGSHIKRLKDIIIKDIITRKGD